MKQYTLEEIENMPTINQGHTDDLKVDTGDMRVWLSRMTVEDGQPYDNEVTVEQYDPNLNRLGGWKTIASYQAK